MIRLGSSMSRDVLSAYAASGAKIASWAIVLAIVYRRLGADALAMLALIRGTIGLLNYTTIGLGPAMIRLFSEANARRGSDADSAEEQDQRQFARIWFSGVLIAGGALLVGGALIFAYAGLFDVLHAVPPSIRAVSKIVLAMGLGLLMRLVSEPAGALLQASGRIAADNLVVAIGELAWPLMLVPVLVSSGGLNLPLVALGFWLSGLVVCTSRYAAAGWLEGRRLTGPRSFSGAVVWRMLSFGSLVMLAQLADYLYAPTDYILINRLISEVEVANYAPAVQIDSGLLLLVSGVAAVLLPKAAAAHAAGDITRVRRYYLRGTLLSAGMLAAAGLIVLMLAPWIFWQWLNSPMLATQSVLPLILIHTVVGGSSAVGRSILIGMGKVRAFTVSVLIAGVVNVGLSYIFVSYFGLGLKGIVLGTIVAVVARCGIWMPWYVLHNLREPIDLPAAEAFPRQPET